MRKPKLCCGEIHTPRDCRKRAVITCVANPRLKADQLIGKIKFANFGERKGRAYVGPLINAAERSLIDRTPFQPKPLQREQPIKCFGLTRACSKPCINAFWMTARHIGTRSPEMASSDHLGVA